MARALVQGIRWNSLRFHLVRSLSTAWLCFWYYSKFALSCISRIIVGSCMAVCCMLYQGLDSSFTHLTCHLLAYAICPITNAASGIAWRWLISLIDKEFGGAR